MSTTMKGQVQTEAEDAIVTHRLDELLNADSDIDGAAPPTVGSVFHELMSKTVGSFTFDQTTDSNEALRDRGDAAWITATGFSTLTQADIRTATGLASANLDTQIGTLATAASLSTVAGYLDTEVAAILADTNELQTDWANGGRLDLLVDSILADTDSLDTTKITTARAAVLTDWIDGGRLDLLLDGVVADNPNRPTQGVELANVMFMMVDATDLSTPETGVTVTATISKDGGAFASCTNSASEVSGGWYKITLTSTEMNAASIAVKFTGSGCAQRNIAFRTQPT
jgi:hypothetical protein